MGLHCACRAVPLSVLLELELFSDNISVINACNLPEYPSYEQPGPVRNSQSRSYTGRRLHVTLARPSAHYTVVARSSFSRGLCLVCSRRSQDNNVFFLKQLGDARSIRYRLLECFERASSPFITVAERSRLLSFVVVGGGPTSIEYAAELHDFLTTDVKRWYPDLQDKARRYFALPSATGIVDDQVLVVMGE